MLSTTKTEPLLDKARPSLESLRHYVETKNFKGYDPYDALNSPLLSLLSFNQKYPRIFWTQLFKHSPINLRKLVGVPETHNPKALGLFLWGYAKLFKLEKDTQHLDKINFFCDQLEKCKSAYSGNGWGYPFDWQSRAFFVPKYTPTIVNSAFIGHALLDAYEWTKLSRLQEMALPIQDFILSDLKHSKEGDNICFSYTPLDATKIHNANVLGASLLLRFSRINQDASLAKIAHQALRYTLGHQREDGSWYYAETDYQRWIDSFHTGFILQSLKYFVDLGEGEGYLESFERGIQFYKTNFFEEDGEPKYFHDRKNPIDIHSPTQAIVFLSSLGLSEKSFVEKIIDWMIENLQDPKGYFYFQIKNNYKYKIAYMRWAQAWAFHALTSYFLNYGNES